VCLGSMDPMPCLAVLQREPPSSAGIVRITKTLPAIQKLLSSGTAQSGDTTETAVNRPSVPVVPRSAACRDLLEFRFAVLVSQESSGKPSAVS
jgi:hypothetical protein